MVQSIPIPRLAEVTPFPGSRIRDEEAPPYDGHAPRREPFAMIPHAVLDEHAAEVGPVAWAVFTALARHADAAGRCYPSHARIGSLLGIKRRETVIAAVKRLVDAGLVEVETRFTEGGTRTSNGYYLPCLCLSAKPYNDVRSEHTPLGVSKPTYPPHETVQQLEPIQRDTENERTSPLYPPRGANAKPAAERKRKLPDDFAVTEEMRTWARAKGIADADIDDQTEQFKNHHRFKGTLGIDWPRGWQTWMTNAIKWNHVGPSKNGRAPSPRSVPPPPPMIERGKAQTGDEMKAAWKARGKVQ